MPGILVAMIGRTLVFACLAGAEALWLSLLFDGASIDAQTGPVALLKQWGAWCLRWALATTVLFAGLAYLKRGKVAGTETGTGPIIRFPWLLCNLAAAGALYAASLEIYHAGSGSTLMVGAWLAAGLGTVISAALTSAPLTEWIAFLRNAGVLAVQSAAAAAAGCLMGAASRELWQPAHRLTFFLAEYGLGAIHGNSIADPGRMRLGTSRFSVIISPECSGLEGVGLMLVFGTLWLFVFRRDFRFPRALALLPAGMAIMYLLNVVRIVALILLGNAGHRDVAARGFHSQAGWIGFCAVAVGFMILSRRSRWFSAEPETETGTDVEYAASPFLIPFMAIMGAGVLSQAVTGTFEWTYFIRIPAAIGALWYSRSRYRSVNWAFGGLAAAAGLGVFAIWVAVDGLLGNGGAAGVPPELREASAGARMLWVTSRVTGAVIIVPIVEELAFRGFLQRRFLSSDFESVSWNASNWFGLGGASIAFGLMHGQLWPAGIAAGLIYGGILSYRGRLGDSIAAHAVTNALLAAYVLVTGKWHLW